MGLAVGLSFSDHRFSGSLQNGTVCHGSGDKHVLSSLASLLPGIPSSTTKGLWFPHYCGVSQLVVAGEGRVFCY